MITIFPIQILINIYILYTNYYKIFIITYSNNLNYITSIKLHNTIYLHTYIIIISNI